MKNGKLKNQKSTGNPKKFDEKNKCMYPFFTVKKIKKVPVTQKIQRKKQMKPLIFLR